jgi:adenylate cyclase
MTRRGRVLPLLLAAIIAAAVGLTVQMTDELNGLEQQSVDARYDLRGDQEPRDDIVIVAIDDATVEGYGEYPFDRRHHARVIRQLTNAGAGTIAYDVQFTQPSRSAAADNALIGAVRAGAPRVVLGTTAVGPGGKTEIFGGAEGLELSRAIPAFSGFVADPDGVMRKMPPASVNDLESFALAAAEVQAKRELGQPAGSFIDFPGPPGTFPVLSFADVERGSFDTSDVRGKVAVVGATADVLEDFARTPTEDRMPGVELEAAATATALDGFPLHYSGRWVNALLVLLLAAVPPFVALRFGALGGIVAGVAGVALFLAGAYVAFGQDVVVGVVPPLVAAATAVAGLVIVSAPVNHPRLNRVLDRLSPGTGINRRTRRLRTLLLLGAAFVCATGGLVLLAVEGLRRLDLTTVDMRFDVRGTREAPDEVVVVAIDDPSLNAAGNIFPFTRKLHARVIRNLDEAGAAVIAYDVQFSQESKSLAADNALIQAVRAASPRVVLAATSVTRDGKTQIFGGAQGLEFSRAVPGYSNFEADSDGVTRHLLDAERGVDSFPVAAAQIKLGRDIDAPPGNSAWIDFAGPPVTVPYLSFIDVARARFQAEDVRGKVVVVGASASALQDLRETSTTGQRQMPGPEVHANAITTALDGFPLESGPGWLNLLLVVVLGTTAPLAAIRCRMMIAVPLGLAALAALLAGAQLAFGAGTIVSVVYAFVAGVAALLATAAIHGLTVAFERATTRDAFARFVPESVVDQVLEDAEGVRLGGVRGEATVMFSDLRGFTSFAETLEPEQVIAALNRYLTAMSEAILDHGGTLVAYMGDGIMAVFGAPLKQDDHADRALAAARDMLARLEGFNQSLRDEELHDGFKMGIGLNSGPVMSGNVGSERRLEYTALGDTTNTAARLEGMTKGTPHQLFLADSTREALLQPADDLIEVGEFEVRGRKAKIKLWSLREGEPEAPPAVQQAAAESPVASSNGSDVGSTADVPRT